MQRDWYILFILILLLISQMKSYVINYMWIFLHFASQIMYSNEVFVHKLFSMNFTAMATQKSHCSLYLFSFYISELPFSKLRTSPSPLLFFFLRFIYFWLWWVFVVAHGLSLFATGSGYFLLWCAGSPLEWLLLELQ